MAPRGRRTRLSASNEDQNQEADSQEEVAVPNQVGSQEEEVALPSITGERSRKVDQAVESIQYVERFVNGGGFENAKAHEVQTQMT